jgi:beta-lactamase class A
MNKYIIPSIALILFISVCNAQVQTTPSQKSQPVQSPLLAEITQVASTVKAVVGVSVVCIEDQDSVSYNGNSRMVMQSVMKLPIAMTVLNMVDQGRLKLDKTIKLRSGDYLKSASPLKDKYPNGDVKLPISDLLAFMVSQSDNNATDILIKTIGGPQIVENYMFSLGVKGISLRASEADMAASWEIQYLNWAKPIAMTHLLEILFKGTALSKSSNDLLLQLLTATTTGPKRLKGLLPPGTIVAHKTGSSSTDASKMTPATNDVGIIMLPNGKHLAIAVFVCNSPEDEATREGVIAQIAKDAFDYYDK